MTSEAFAYPLSETIRSIALTLPDATEGSSCVNRAFRAGGKNFAFLGEKDSQSHVRLKLRESADEVAELATRYPDRYTIGPSGWASLRMSPDDHPSIPSLERWIAESYRLLTSTRSRRHSA